MISKISSKILSLLFILLFISTFTSCPIFNNGGYYGNIGIPHFLNGEEVFFYPTIIGESKTESITLENRGSEVLEIDSALLLSNTGEYDITNLTKQLPIELESREKLTFDIKFSPKFVKTTHKNNSRNCIWFAII